MHRHEAQAHRCIRRLERRCWVIRRLSYTKDLGQLGQSQMTSRAPRLLLIAYREKQIFLMVNRAAALVNRGLFVNFNVLWFFVYSPSVTVGYYHLSR
jgi:hypothetical protein